jgi:hypothetical protein
MAASSEGLALQRGNKMSNVNWEIFAACEPEVAAYLESNLSNSFMKSLHDQASKRGELSEKQLACVEKNIGQKDRWSDDRAKPAGHSIDLSAVFEKFATARDAGLKRPKLRLENFCFSLMGGKNAGAIAVKTGPGYDDTYLGKVFSDGVFFKTHACSDSQLEELQRISGDVLAAAREYGAISGTCSCCGRALDRAESVKMGIGPVCAEKWGLGGARMAEEAKRKEFATATDYILDRPEAAPVAPAATIVEEDASATLSDLMAQDREMEAAGCTAADYYAQTHGA